jgi:hypothetical protein
MNRTRRAVDGGSCPGASRRGFAGALAGVRAKALASSLAGALLTSACFAPDVGQFSCEVRCTATCESPLECRDGWCVLPGAPACDEPELSTNPEQPAPAAECADASLLQIELSPEPAASACVGDPIALTLSVVGGSPPYTWSSTGLDDIELQQSTSSTLQVQGAFATPGRRDVTIAVRSGEAQGCEPASLSFPIDIVAPPRIETAVLGEACVGEPYAAALVGGKGPAAVDAADEGTWAVIGALPSGLRLEGDQLVGTPSEGGAFSIDVTLDAGRCAPARRRLALKVRAAGECPRIDPVALAAPCEGVPYAQALSAVNGQPPYSWRLIDGPAWLEFDAEAASLHGTPGAAASQALTLEVSDSLQHVTRRSYTLAPRQSCYFAYVSQAGVAPGLHYADVFAARDVLVSQAVPDGAAVTDFAFSPDGAFLAFRAGAEGAAALYLYPTDSVSPADPDSVLPLPFECPESASGCAVLDYAWSEDSSHVAVVLGEPGAAGNYLSGIDVDAPELPFARVDAQYRQRLAWVGSSAVVFSGELSALPGVQVPSFASFDAGGSAFAIPAGAPVPASAWEVRPTPTGAFFFEGNLNMVHLAITPQPSIEAHAPGWLSPSGRYAAAANQEGRLQLYAVGDPRTLLAESEPGACEVVFAWAEHREVIACTRSESSALGQGATDPDLIGGLPFSHGSALRIFDFRPDAAPGARLVNWAVPIERYFQVATAGHRRAFSPDGQWLAFYGEDEDGSEVLQAISALPEVTSGFSTSGSEGTADIELGFSPAGDAFVTYDDALTRRLPPDRSERSVRLSDELDGAFAAAPPGACAEEFYANPARWCGSPSVPNHFRFSPDGASLLFEDANHGLWLSDSSPTHAVVRATGASLPECTGACSSRQYDFRPDAVH